MEYLNAVGEYNSHAGIDNFEWITLIDVYKDNIQQWMHVQTMIVCKQQPANLT